MDRRSDVCPECGRSVMLRKDGNLRQHRVSRSGTGCMGGNQPSYSLYGECTLCGCVERLEWRILSGRHTYSLCLAEQHACGAPLAYAMIEKEES